VLCLIQAVLVGVDCSDGGSSLIEYMAYVCVEYDFATTSGDLTDRYYCDTHVRGM
jgi:hypothetical protein